MNYFKKFVEEEVKCMLADKQGNTKLVEGLKTADAAKIAEKVAKDDYVTEKVNELIADCIREYKKENKIK